MRKLLLASDLPESDIFFLFLFSGLEEACEGIKPEILQNLHFIKS